MFICDVWQMKSLYRHKASGDIFAIEVDGSGKVISTSGPLFNDGLDQMGDYEEQISIGAKAPLAFRSAPLSPQEQGSENED